MRDGHGMVAEQGDRVTLFIIFLPNKVGGSV